MEAVLFDWAGTTVDYGSFAPVQAFQDAFAHYQIPVTLEETRKPMGMLKIDHIRTMLHMPRIAGLWKQVNGRPADEKDVQAIYDQFEPKLLSILSGYAAPKPHVLEAVAQLRQMGLRIGSTTGYNDKMMAVVVPEAAAQGYAPDVWVSPDQVGGQGRPAPYMIFENMKRLGVSAVQQVIKVGDTVADIQEGLRAGVWSVGVLEGSSELGLCEEEFQALSPDQRQDHLHRTEETFRRAGAHFVLDNLSQLPGLVRALGSVG